MKKVLLSIFLVFSGWILYAQELTVSGTVTSSKDGSPLPGVTVTILEAPSKGTITDINGYFQIKVGNNQSLVFSFVGMETQTVLVKGQTTINVAMTEISTSIDELVVVGYGTQKKSLVTGAIAKVSQEEINKGANLRVNQAIQGKTAGVVVSSNSGQPGDFVSVRVRGIGTNGNAEPLYIVDGLPTNGYGIDYLTPADIESIEVLKDAASAAIYGARGANGVVLISTKTGKKTQKFEVAYEGYQGLQNAQKKLTTLNKDQYIEMMKESYANAGAAFPWTDAALDTMSNTDWQNEMFVNDAKKVSHILSFTGGSENSTYSSSLSYFKQDGIVGKGKSNFERYTWRLNTTREFGILTVGMNFNLANIKSKGIDANDRYGISLAQAVNMPPLVPVKQYNGKFATPENYLGVGLQEITNPVALMSILNSEYVTNKANGGLWGEFDFGKLHAILNGLKFKSQYATEYAYVNGRSYTPVYNFSSTKYNQINSVSDSYDKYVNWNFDNYLTYDKTLNEHHFTAMAGVSALRNWYTNVSASKKQLIFDDFENAYLDNATLSESATNGGGFSDHTMFSYVGRLNYDFKSRYMLTATYRVDGSSRFGSENKYAKFPSISAGWVISNESFMPQTDIINLLKLRASWGRNGNESIGDFAYTSTMGTGALYFFGQGKVQYNGAQPTRISNPNLKWETSQQTDIALDMGFFMNKITLTIDYYNKRTKDWLVQAPVPIIIGNVAPIINGGEISNKGLEFELGYKTSISDLKFDVMLTGAFNKNEVVDIKNSEKSLSGGDGGFGQSGIIRFSVGDQAGYFYGYQVAGIFQNQAEINAYVGPDGTTKIQPNAVPGDFKFVDQNGDGKLTDAADRVKLGSPNPKFTGGFNFNASWKGFDLNMFWYSALGQDVWMAIRRYDQPVSNYTAEYYKNRWTGEGTSNTYPRVTTVDNNNNWKTPSSFYVHDASYLRLKNLTLGYTLPLSISKIAKVTKLRVYISGENLLTFSKYPGYEPEIGGGVFGNGIDRGIYPQARTVISGINITF